MQDEWRQAALQLLTEPGDGVTVGISAYNARRLQLKQLLMGHRNVLMDQFWTTDLTLA